MSPAVTKAGGIATDVVSWSDEHVIKNLAVNFM